MWLCEPTTVTSPSPVALWMVTPSRKVLLSPIFVRVMPPFHFKSWVLSPMLAKGNISFFLPSFVWPSMTTCECNWQRGPRTTCSPMTQYGPIWQPSPMRALGCTTAVLWIMKTRNGLAGHQHERDFRFAHDFIANFADTFGLAEVAAHLGQLDFDDQHVSGQYRLAPPHIVRGHEVGDLPGIFGAAQHQNSRDLRHRFQLQHARHDRMAGEMSLKKRFVEREVFDADDFIAVYFRHAIHHQKRIAMRQNLHDLHRIERAAFVHDLQHVGLLVFRAFWGGWRRPEGLRCDERFAHLRTHEPGHFAIRRVARFYRDQMAKQRTARERKVADDEIGRASCR